MTERTYPDTFERCTAMYERWSEEAIVFLDGEDHDEYATSLIIAAFIQIARALMADDNPEQRAHFVRLLSKEGVDINLGSTQ